MQKRYQNNKLVEKLLSKGHGAKFGKYLVGIICTAPPNIVQDVEMNDLDFTNLVTWEKETKGFSNVSEAISKYKTACTVKVQDKLSSLAAAMDENEKWHGALARIDGGAACLDWEAIGLPEPVCADEEGASPWLAGMKKFANRYGPSAWPWPGLGALIQAEGVSGYVMVMPIDPLVSQGLVALNDFPAFCETETGQSLLMKYGKLITLSPGDFLDPLRLPRDASVCS